MINNFSCQWDFLSNFYPARIVYDSIAYPSIEHAFQAAKTKDKELRLAIRAAKTPGEAKRMGSQVQLRPEWELVKVDVMLQLLRLKFYPENMAALLLSTGDHELVEGNHWQDTFWGVCNGVGENWLGRLLMQVRTEIKERRCSFTV